jgi:hypothetical protein
VAESCRSLMMGVSRDSAVAQNLAARLAFACDPVQVLNGRHRYDSQSCCRAAYQVPDDEAPTSAQQEEQKLAV